MGGPPSLMQTPCAFKQTTSIYTNPLAELTKAREAAAAAVGSPGEQQAHKAMQEATRKFVAAIARSTFEAFVESLQIPRLQEQLDRLGVEVLTDLSFVGDGNCRTQYRH